MIFTRIARRAVYEVAYRLAWSLLAVVRRVSPRAFVHLRETWAFPLPLDHPTEKLRIQVDSLTELFLRRNSCAKEPETVAWLEGSLRPGDVFYDIGANIGPYSLLAARLIDGKAVVYAFEPGAANFHQLVRNVQLNRLSNVHPLQFALGDRTTLALFHYRDVASGSAMHWLGDSPPFAPAFTQQLPVYRLDDLIDTFGLPTPHLLKIDVDGGEEAVLGGAPRTLRDQTLRSVLVEVDRTTEDRAGIFAALEGAGFGVASSRKHGAYDVWNYIFTRGA